MKRVTIVQSFDGHPIGSKVEMTDAQADSAVIQKRGVVMPEDNEPAEKPKAKRKAPAKTKAPARKKAAAKKK